MKRLNKNLPAAQLLMRSFAIEGDDEVVGCIVRFVKFDGRGTYHRDNLFEVVGRQRVRGYDEKGKYSTIDGYRLIAIGIGDQFGTPAARDEFEVLSSNN